MAFKTSLLGWLLHRRSPFGLFWKSLRHDFNWRGRASVAEFWNFVLFVVLILAATVSGLQSLGGLSGASVPERTEEIGFLIVFLMLLPPFVSVFVRRLHDTGRYAWQGLFLMVLPGVGTVILFYLMVRPGLNYETIFGVEPRYDAQ